MANNDEKADHLTRDELAYRWDVHVRTIDRWVRLGKIQAIRLGPKCIRFDGAMIRLIEKAGDLN